MKIYSKKLLYIYIGLSVSIIYFCNPKAITHIDIPEFHLLIADFQTGHT